MSKSFLGFFLPNLAKIAFSIEVIIEGENFLGCIRTEVGDINRAIKSANAEIKNINAEILKLENELQQLKSELQQDEAQATTPAPFEGYTKAHTAEWQKKLDQQKSEHPKVDAPKSTKQNSAVIQTTSAITSTLKPQSASKPTPTNKPTPAPKTFEQVEKEIELVERKLSRLDHVASVVMSYNHRIEDEQRNLHTVGWWERRKMLKEITNQEQKRNAYQANGA